MEFIKKYKWRIISSVLILMLIGGGTNYIIKKSDREVAELQVKIDKIIDEKNDILIEKSDIEARYEELKKHPQKQIVKVPVIKYKTIEKIKYVESSKYEETWNAWENCDRNFNLCIDQFDEYRLNYDYYIEKTDKQIKLTEKQSGIYKDARDLLARKRKGIYGAVTLSALGGEVALRSDGSMDSKIILLKLSAYLFNKDIIRIN